MTQSYGASTLWPNGTDYARSIQHPSASFVDQRLKTTAPATNAMGMPLAATGQNAIVFLVRSATGDVAVRCFTRPPLDASSRYVALQRHLAASPPTAIVATEWIEPGIVVDESSWPVVMMPWVSGVPLNVAVEDRLDDPAALRRMADQWRDAVEALQRAVVCHGDLQHGNVLVRDDGSLALVDLDGAWVPGTVVNPPAENGHPNYQHPGRTVEQWSRFGDSFPALVIETSLRALAANPELGSLLGSESLLFTTAELSDTDGPLWDALALVDDDECRRLVTALRAAASAPANASLRDYVSLRVDGPLDAPPEATIRRAPATVPGPVAAGSADWWEQAGSGAAPTPTAPAPAPPVPPAPQYVDPPAAAVAAPPVAARAATKPTLRTRLAATPPVAGLVGGGLAGLFGAWITGILGALGTSTIVMPAVFVVSVSLLLGAFLRSWQSLATGSRGGWRRFAIGGLLGALAGAASLGLAAAVFLAAPRTDHATLLPDGLIHHRYTYPSAALGLAWAIVAGFVGLVLGLTERWKAALFGLLGGLAAGFVGGVVMNVTVAEFHGRLLIVRGGHPATFALVAGVGAVIGLAIGAASQRASRARLVVIEGRLAGLETVVQRRRCTIGSGPTDTLVLDDPGVVPATLEISFERSDVARLEAKRPVVVNGVPRQGAFDLHSGDVIAVGSSFVRFELTGGQR